MNLGKFLTFVTWDISMDSRITYFKLVPKQILGPFLTLSIRMDQNSKLSFSRVNIFTIYIQAEQNRILHHIFIKNG